MPEQRAWSAASVQHSLQQPPTPIHSLSLLLLWSPFPQQLPFSLSFSHSNCYLSLIFTITAMFTFHFSLTRLFFSLSLLLDHPSPVLLSYLFISFSAHVILCSLIVLHLLVPSFLLSASPALTVLSLFSPKLFIHSCFEKGWKEEKKSRSHREMKIEKRKKYEERGTSKRGETKSSLLSLWWEKMSEGAIIKLEFFNTVKNGALTAHRQCKGQAPTTHGEPPN